MRNKGKGILRWWWILFLVVAILLLITVYGLVDKKKPEMSEKTAKVTRVIDGDTIETLTEGKVDTVRLIGIDAPETMPAECFGEESYVYVRKALENANVRLAGDDRFDDKDKYGRLLRYVYLEDGLNFNLLLIEQGYAREYYFMGIDYQFHEEFASREAAAKLQKSGLWGKCK